MLTSLEIERVEPLADGAAFGAAGPYERVIGKARGEVDPAHPGNKGIALIDKAPLNARGRVEYTTDIFILRPRDPARGNGRILYEVNNRGRKMLFGNIADGPQGVNDPKSAKDVGNGFPLRRGYTIVWSGWDPDAPRANMGLALSAPIATDDGKPIVQTVREEFVSGTRGGALEVFKLSYEAASLEQPRCRLTMRERAADEPRELPLNQWSFVDGRTIRLREGTKPKPGWLYEFHYEAQESEGAGAGLRRHPRRGELPAPRPGAAASRPAGRSATRSPSASRRPAATCATTSPRASTATKQGRRVFDGIHSAHRRRRPHLLQHAVRPAGAHRHAARGSRLPGERVPVLDGRSSPIR